ncbi:NnrU family protein [Amorphus sp. 3PC139-8]
MWIMLVGLVVFLGAHLVPTAPRLRDALLGWLGDGLYRIVFSLVAFVGLVLIIWGYGEWRSAGPAILYVSPSWMRHITMLLMLPVFVLIVAAYAPGTIRQRLKHPMILAVKIWAFAHLLANGDVASVVLFVAFLAWAVIDRISLKRRQPAGWPGGASRASVRADMVAIVVGLLVYALFVWKVHVWLIGVPVLA